MSINLKLLLLAKHQHHLISSWNVYKLGHDNQCLRKFCALEAMGLYSYYETYQETVYPWRGSSVINTVVDSVLHHRAVMFVKWLVPYRQYLSWSSYHLQKRYPFLWSSHDILSFGCQFQI
jgi:hypothetical protein